MDQKLSGEQINYLAAAAADYLTDGAGTEEIRRMLLFVDGLRTGLNGILTCRLFEKSMDPAAEKRLDRRLARRMESGTEPGRVIKQPLPPKK